ncbi:MAG TPA: hypothetical protein DCX08_04810 [Porticoccaceae bacterium]|jgi:Fe2+ or Zn2+ uptake regulation protein|nr:hypothetical protein [Porticoccaceae bacterium]
MPLSGRQANTDKRSSIEIIMAKPPILGAFQLQEQVANIIHKPVTPSIVYRALEFLLGPGCINGLSYLNAYISYPFHNNQYSNMFMICNTCGSPARVTHVAANKLLQQATDRVGFNLTSQSIEPFGLCPQCAEQYTE